MERDEREEQNLITRRNTQMGEAQPNLSDAGMFIHSLSLGFVEAIIILAASVSILVFQSIVSFFYDFLTIAGHEKMLV